MTSVGIATGRDKALLKSRCSSPGGQSLHPPHQHQPFLESSGSAIRGIAAINNPEIWDSKAWRSCCTKETGADTTAPWGCCFTIHAQIPPVGGRRFLGDSGWETGRGDHQRKQNEKLERCKGAGRSASGAPHWQVGERRTGGQNTPFSWRVVYAFCFARIKTTLRTCPRSAHSCPGA